MHALFPGDRERSRRRCGPPLTRPAIYWAWHSNAVGCAVARRCGSCSETVGDVDEEVEHAGALVEPGRLADAPALLVRF